MQLFSQKIFFLLLFKLFLAAPRLFYVPQTGERVARISRRSGCMQQQLVVVCVRVRARACACAFKKKAH